MNYRSPSYLWLLHYLNMLPSKSIYSEIIVSLLWVKSIEYVATHLHAVEEEHTSPTPLRFSPFLLGGERLLYNLQATQTPMESLTSCPGNSLGPQVAWFKDAARADAISNARLGSENDTEAQYIPTNHPAFCLIIKQKYYLSLQIIAKSLFFVNTCVAPCLYILNGHTAFSANTLQIKQIWHISQAKVHLQVGRYELYYRGWCWTDASTYV